MKRLRLWLAIVLLLFTACGGGNNPTDLLVIGNSITIHGANPSIGWDGSWGMAAPSPDKDYSHLVASTLQIPVSVNNMSIEFDPESALSQIPAMVSKVGPRTDVVLEFGDNVPGNQHDAFAKAYGQLAAAVAKSHSFVCVSTFWEQPAIDTIIKGACAAHGGRYAYIGDIFTNPLNTDRQSAPFLDWHIDVHPREWGHAHIAERVLLQLAGEN